MNSKLASVLDAATGIGHLLWSPPAIAFREHGVSLSMDSEQGEDLLARAVRGEFVELLIDFDAYEQKPGLVNRKSVRFRDGLMMALGRSGNGRPFLRDHDQGSVLARGGTILESSTEKRGEGDYLVRQTAKLVAPWAVEMALRGLMSTVSIGFVPTGKVECSICGGELLDFANCTHWPGSNYEMDDGAERVCEAIMTSAELVETSAVNVPAVPSAHITQVRAALSASTTPALRTSPRAAAPFAAPPISAPRGVVMTKKADEDAFIANGVNRGAIYPGAHEEAFRNLFRVNPDQARACLAERTGSPAYALTAPTAAPVQEKPMPKSNYQRALEYRTALTSSPAYARKAYQAYSTSTFEAPAGMPTEEELDDALRAIHVDPADLRARLLWDGLDVPAIYRQLSAMASHKTEDVSRQERISSQAAPARTSGATAATLSRAELDDALARSVGGPARAAKLRADLRASGMSDDQIDHQLRAWAVVS